MSNYSKLRTQCKVVVECPYCHKTFHPFWPKGFAVGGKSLRLPESHLGKLLRQWRMDLNYSYKMAAAEIDIHPGTLKRIENRSGNNRADARTLAKLIKSGVRDSTNSVATLLIARKVQIVYSKDSHLSALLRLIPNVDASRLWFWQSPGRPR